MSTTRIQSDTTQRVFFTLLDSAGEAVTGLTGAQLDVLTLLRKSDGTYWDGVAWGASKTDLAVTEQDATNSPGLYFFDPPSLSEDHYYMRVDTSDAENDPLEGELVVGDWVDDAVLAKQLLFHKYTIDEANSKVQLWNLAGDTIIWEWPLTDKDGNVVVLQGTGPANRGIPSAP